jgi:hypothetical protein
VIAMATKMKEGRWIDRPRMERFASLLYPNLVDASTQSQMLKELNKEDGRAGGLSRRIKTTEAMYQPKKGKGGSSW